MLRGQTYQERRYGSPPGCDALVAIWTNDLTDRLLSLVWNAYDALYEDGWSREDWTQQSDDLERSLSEELEQAIHTAMDGYLPVDVQHAPCEREARADPPAQPPQYDIAFKWRGDPRIMWPLEAKVLKSDANTEANLGDYIRTLQERLLTGYYAPFSNGGAMVGYLKSGDAEAVLDNIALRLGCTLTPYAQSFNRSHRVSDHQRIIPAGKDYPIAFRCHHLILPLSNASPQVQQPPIPVPSG